MRAVHATNGFDDDAAGNDVAGVDEFVAAAVEHGGGDDIAHFGHSNDELDL